MDFVEKARLLDRLYNYFKSHPTTATRKGFEEFARKTITRKTFIRYVEYVRQVYRCSVVFNDSTKTYITKLTV